MKKPNKKADISGRKMIFYMIFSFVGAIVFMIIVYISSSQESKIAQIPNQLEDSILIHRFLNSEECFVFYDEEIKRAYPETLDISKFNQENMDICYDAAIGSKAFRISVEYGGKNLQISTKNWEGFLKRSQTKTIFIYDAGQIKQGKIKIEVEDAK